jgi:hypothetical protein
MGNVCDRHGTLVDSAEVVTVIAVEVVEFRDSQKVRVAINVVVHDDLDFVAE